jgi:hypothetical protein
VGTFLEPVSGPKPPMGPSPAHPPLRRGNVIRYGRYFVTVMLGTGYVMLRPIAGTRPRKYPTGIYHGDTVPLSLFVSMLVGGHG